MELGLRRHPPCQRRGCGVYGAVLAQYRVGLILLPFALAIGPRITRRAVAEQLLLGFLGMVLYLGGFALAICWRVPTGLVTLMDDLMPMAIAALSLPMLGQRLTRRQ